ncbi:TIR domain-containing protein [Hyalangium sp.]|uniref:nSTAND1 domain-containing NTPase n=1 Tax=Hyalangium sp. TaxID=2028555 RepID=UPI002D3B1342|nr:TIR domain-containing protein [Hyalangium sp.]HYH94670.1 TIR domain-containing protein [Hyalangium sp.]
MYDVFLSHSSTDKPAVEHIARRLREQGLHPFLDKWHLIPGAPWVPALAQALSESETAAVFFGPSAPAPWHNEEMQLALSRAVRSRADFRLIPVLLPGATPEQLAGFIGLRTYVDFREGLDSEAELARLVAGIKGRAPAGQSLTLPEDPAPYRGLLAFDEAHGEYFFGREPDIEQTLAKIERERFVAVVGPSGSGKSSLVLGGVLPRLKQPGGILGPCVRTWTLRPGDRPLRALADAIAAREASGEQRLTLSDSLHRRFLESPDGLRTTLTTLTADRPGPCILVVDQFEELFTHAPSNGSPGEREPFVANLQDAALEGSGPVRILITLRADFFNRCLDLAPLRRLLQDRAVLLGSLDEEALHDVILRPAQKVGATLERGLLDTILKEFSREPGALPLLEDTLDQLWRARKGEWLTLDAYKRSGGISRALQTRAQACYDALGPEEQEVARLLLVRLTSLGEGREDTRRRVPLVELRFGDIPDARVEHVLRVLSGPAARLIVVDKGSVEMAHEILILTWPTLRRWLDEDRRELRVERRLLEDAEEWDKKGREAGYLSTGARLLEAEELFKHKPTLLNQLESDFLTASLLQRDQHQRDKEEQARRDVEAARRLAEETEARRKLEAESAAKVRQSVRQLRWLVVGLLAAFALLYGQYQRAEQEKRVGFSRELVLSARQSIREDPQRALLLLQEAQRLAPVATLGELLDEWSREPCLMVLPGNGAFLFQASFSPDGTRLITTADDNRARLWDASSGRLVAVFKGTTVAFSRDGTRLLTATRDGIAYLWEASSGKKLFTLEGHSSVVWIVAFSPDGKRLLTASHDGTARLWDASSGKLLAILQGHSDVVGTAVFSPDGSRVLTASHDGTARLWDAFSGKSLFTLHGHSKEVNSAVFNPDGSRVLTASDDGTARLWDASSGKSLFTLHGHSKEVNSAAFSPDGTRVITASRDETVRLWETATGKHLSTLHGHPGPIGWVTFSPDGSRILTAYYDTARLWDVASGRPLINLEGHTNSVRSVEFSPDGKRIVTASFDGTARIWDVTAGKPLATLKDDAKDQVAAEFSPDGSRLLTSEGNTTHLSETTAGKRLATLQGRFKATEPAAFSPDGSRVLTASPDGLVHSWEVSSGASLFSFQGEAEAPGTMRFSPDGTRILTVSGKGTARLWEAASGRPLSTFAGSHRGLLEAAFSPDSTRVFIASQKSVGSWETSSGKPLVTFGVSSGDGSSGMLMDASLSPDGTRALTHDISMETIPEKPSTQPPPKELPRMGTSTMSLWDAFSGKRLVEVKSGFPPKTRIEFSPDGTHFLTIGNGGDIGLWDTSSGRVLLTLHTNFALWSAQLSPDNSRVLSVFYQGEGIVWDASSGKPMIRLEGHTEAVNAMTFNRDSSYILTASTDGTARIWEAASGKPLATFWGHRGPVSTVAINRDSTRLLTIGRDGTVRLWPDWRWNAKAFAKLDVGRHLTCEERVEFLHEDIDCPEEPDPRFSGEDSSETTAAEH